MSVIIDVFNYCSVWPALSLACGMSYIVVLCTPCLTDAFGNEI